MSQLRAGPVACATDYGLLAAGLYAEKKIKAAKRLAVSTGKLRPLLTLHIRPIDLVVFQEPTFPKELET